MEKQNMKILNLNHAWAIVDFGLIVAPYGRCAIFKTRKDARNYKCVGHKIVKIKITKA